MATTKIWDVSDSLERVIDYATNEEKTSHEDEVENVLNYAIQDVKTEEQLYVTGINCEVSTAKQEMKATKIRYGKTDGILAYHAIQSFAPGEVDAKTAHMIGVEFAVKVWGERFEVVLSTHTDKHHLHNHFVINSVSFKDGKKYYDNKTTYKEIRKQSDILCEKYKLSVIKNPQNNGWHYAEWLAEKEHKPTLRSLIRNDVDEAIEKSRTYTQFIKELKAMGYKVKTIVKYIAISPYGSDRYIRLRSLSKDGRYEEISIKERILMNTKVRLEPFQNASVRKFYYHGDRKKARKLKGLRALYFKYLYLMGILPKHAPNNKKVHFLLKEDLRYMDQITNEVTLLCKNRIDTLEQLDNKISALSEQKEKLIKERKCYYGKIKRCKNQEVKEKLQIDVQSLTDEIKAITKEVKSYESIKNRSLVIKNKMETVRNEQKTTEYQKEDKKEIFYKR